MISVKYNMSGGTSGARAFSSTDSSRGRQRAVQTSYGSANSLNVLINEDGDEENHVSGKVELSWGLTEIYILALKVASKRSHLEPSKESFHLFPFLCFQQFSSFAWGTLWAMLVFFKLP